jgi:hypothetical protein
MDDHRFDAMVRTLAGSRRTVLGGAIAAAVGTLAQPESEGRGRRRKCKAPKVKCGKKCLPAGSCCGNSDCGTCQVCSGKTCVVAPPGTACGVGGTCNGTACLNEGSFGCSLEQDYCAGEARTPCPRSSTPGAVCITNDAGKAQCAVGDCIFGNTAAACEAAFGDGAELKGFCSPCALGGPADPRNGCFRLVTE